MPSIIEETKLEFQKALVHLENELRNIRSGRANAAIVESVKVEAYGSSMELKGVASISSPDAKTIQIEPWDKGLIKDVEKALIAANLGMAPNVAGTTIRLVMPPMTEEKRRETVKVTSQKGEQARISIRGIREEAREKILKQEKVKEISEDERFKFTEELDKVVGDFNKKIDQMVKEKEEEVMTV